MRSFIAASAYAVALLGFASTAVAQVNTTGHVGLQYMRGDYREGFSGTSGDIDFYTLEGAARSSADNFGFSLDGRVTYSNPGDYHQTAFAGTAHVNTKLADDFAILGAFGGVDRSEDAKVWGVGLEAQLNVSDTVLLYAQAGYGESKDLYPFLTQVWAERADLRFFPTDNLKLQASGSYQSAKIGPIDTHTWIAGLEAEYQLPNTGLSLLAAYDRYSMSLIDGRGDILRLGARYSFGAKSLKQRERSGEDMGTVQRLFEVEQLR